MVIARQHDQVVQPAAVDSHVGVGQYRLNTDQDHIGIQRLRREAQQHQWHQHASAGQQDFNEVHAGAGEPVHVRTGVMHRVNAPQPWHYMVEPVQPVLTEIGDQYRQQKLHNERQALHARLQARRHRPTGDVTRRGGDENQDELHQHVADEKVGQVGAPVRAQDVLLGVLGIELFQRNEHDGRHQQRQHKPVQTERVRRLPDRADLDIGTAQKHCQPRRHQSGNPQTFALVEQDIQGAEAERQHQTEQQRGARKLLVIDLAQFSRGQPFREEKAEYRQQAQQPEGG
ncbi:hypothetical protein D3C81_1102800 [compost metagenome]